MQDPSSSTSSLLASLPELETSLGVLEQQPWSETQEQLGTLERAKMDILLSYAINDLIWVYLKLKGIDPADHEVSGELERIKTYYAKIRAVEEPESQRTKTVDRAAAHRFISASIPRSQRIAHKPDSDVPSTSAAASALEQAKQAVKEQEDEAQLELLGMDRRFRFVASEGERIPVGEDWDGAEEEDEGVEEEDGIESEHDDKKESEDGEGDDAEAFMRGFDEEMGDTTSQSSDQWEENHAHDNQTRQMKKRSRPAAKKRKRAEDMTCELS